MDKQREEMKREREMLHDHYELVKQFSIPKDQPDGPKQPVIPPRFHRFSFSRLLKSLKGASNRDHSNEGPLPSKLEAPGHACPKAMHRLNSSPVNSGGGGGSKFKKSSLTMSLSRLERKRTPSPDKRKSLPHVGRHKRHGSDDFKYGGECVHVCVRVHISYMHMTL